MTKPYTAEARSWGPGPAIFEIFLEPTCPFSVKVFNKLDELLEKVGPDMDTTSAQIITRIETYSGVKPAAAFAIPELRTEVQFHTKYAPQKDIYVPPLVWLC